MKLLLTGPQGAGKTTVAPLVAAAWERGVCIEGDVYRRFVVSGRAEMTADAPEEALWQLQLRYGLAAHAAAVYAGSGFDVVVEDVVAGPLLAEWAHHYDRVVVLFPREDAIRARHSAWVYRLFAEETPRIGEWLDNSDLTPEQTAAAILRA